MQMLQTTNLWSAIDWSSMWKWNNWNVYFWSLLHSLQHDMVSTKPGWDKDRTLRKFFKTTKAPSIKRNNNSLIHLVSGWVRFRNRLQMSWNWVRSGHNKPLIKPWRPHDLYGIWQISVFLFFYSFYNQLHFHKNKT